MADECTWASLDDPFVEIGFHKWDGPLRPDLQSIFGTSDQDGTIGSQDYQIDDKPRAIQATVWGTPDSDRTAASGTTARDGTHSKLIDAKNRVGVLVFYDGYRISKVRLEDVIYQRPIGIGTGEFSPVYEEVLTFWVVEG